MKLLSRFEMNVWGQTSDRVSYLGLPRLKEFCEESIARNCDCSHSVRRSSLAFNTDPIENFVKKNLKEAIDAYICARRCNARHLDQLMFFDICSNANLTWMGVCEERLLLIRQNRNPWTSLERP
jgi:hypothetical protein